MFPGVYGSIVRFLERLVTLVAGILTVCRHPVLVEQTLPPRRPISAAACVGAVTARTCEEMGKLRMEQDGHPPVLIHSLVVSIFAKAQLKICQKDISHLFDYSTCYFWLCLLNLRYYGTLTDHFTSPAGLPAVRHHPSRVRLTLPVRFPLFTLQVAPVVVRTR